MHYSLNNFMCNARMLPSAGRDVSTWLSRLLGWMWEGDGRCMRGVCVCVCLTVKLNINQIFAHITAPATAVIFRIILP